MLKYIIGILIIILNMFDGIFTQYAITHLNAIEANPIVKFLINNLGSYWLIPKILAGFFAGLCVMKYWKYRTAKIGGMITAGLYLLLCAYLIIIVLL